MDTQPQFVFLLFFSSGFFFFYPSISFPGFFPVQVSVLPLWTLLLHVINQRFFLQKLQMSDGPPHPDIAVTDRLTRGGALPVEVFPLHLQRFLLRHNARIQACVSVSKSSISCGQLSVCQTSRGRLLLLLPITAQDSLHLCLSWIRTATVQWWFLLVGFPGQPTVLPCRLQILIQALLLCLKVFDDAVGDGADGVHHHAADEQPCGSDVVERQHADSDGSDAFNHADKAGGDGRVDVGAVQRGEVHGAANEDAEDENDSDVRVVPALIGPHVDAIHGDDGADEQHLSKRHRETLARKVESSSSGTLRWANKG